MEVPSPPPPDDDQSLLAWLRQPQTMIGLSAVLLSVCGLFVSIYEATLVREQQRASVWPYVQIGRSYGEDQVSLSVGNKGVGPARIRAAALVYNGETMDGWKDFLQKAGPDLMRGLERSPQLSDYVDLINGDVLSADEGYSEIFQLSVSDVDTARADTASRTVLRRLEDRIESGSLDVRICYCSVFGECWVTTLQQQIDPEDRRSAGGAFTGDGTRRVETCTGQPESNI